MRIFEVRQIPICKFAHVYDAERYVHDLSVSEGSVEITYVSDGALTVIKDGETLIAHRGDLIFNDFKSMTTVKSGEYHCHHTVCFRADIELTRPISHVISLQHNSTQIYHLIDEIIKLNSLERDCGNKCAGLFLQLLGEIEGLLSESSGRLGEYLYVKKAKQYIYENLRAQISQSDLAAFLGITPEYLCSVFKRATGESVIKYVNRMKLEGVLSLMERESLPLYRAAERYGFSDPNYVSRIYSKYYGVSITDVDRLKYKKKYES